MSRKKAVVPAETMLAKFGPVLDGYAKRPEWVPFFTQMPPMGAKGNFGDITKQMDLAQVRAKLQNGDYSDPVELLEDVWQTFANARLYFKTSDPIHARANELRSAFVEAVTPSFEELGYCCGDNRDLPPPRLLCANCDEWVSWGKLFFAAREFEDVSGFAPVMCNKCFKYCEETFPMPNADESKEGIPRGAFVKGRHNVVEQEKRVPCVGCGRRLHPTCVGYTEYHDGFFMCPQCGQDAECSTTRAEYLPTCALSQYIEEIVNKFVFTASLAGSVERRPRKIFIRVLASTTKEANFKPLLKARYNLTPMEYVSRTIYAFQEIDDCNEVCFFGFRVQEFDDKCSYRPNRRCIYLEYIDSIKMFDPDALRTRVYQQILLAYFSFARYDGLLRVHIWSCPPSSKDPCYMFPSRPTDQKIPGKGRLYEWYIKMLTKGQEMGIVTAFADILPQIEKDRVKSFRQMAYFEGDYTAALREEVLKKGEEETRPRRSPNNSEAHQETKPDLDKRSGSLDAISDAVIMNELIYKLGYRKNEFIVVELKPALIGFLANRCVVRCPLIEDRIAFMRKVRETKSLSLGFETQRRAAQATKYLVAWSRDVLEVAQSECTFCVQPCDGASAICTSCENADEAQKVRAVDAFLDRTHHLKLALDVLEHAMKCRLGSCVYRLCGGFKILLKLFSRGGGTVEGLPELFLDAVKLHKHNCSKQECSVPGCKARQMQLRTAAKRSFSCLHASGSKECVVPRGHVTPQHSAADGAKRSKALSSASSTPRASSSGIRRK